MSSSVPSNSPLRHGERLAGTPAVRHDGQWWLVAASGALPVTDTALAQDLDQHAADLRAADQAVADLTGSERRSG